MAALLAASPREAPSPPVLTYEALMRIEGPKRQEAFLRLPAALKSEIMKTHMRRYLAAHLDDLSEEQRALIEENLAVLAPQFYEEPTTAEWRDRAIALFKKAQALFSPEEMREIFTLAGPGLPEND